MEIEILAVVWIVFKVFIFALLSIFVLFTICFPIGDKDTTSAQWLIFLVTEVFIFEAMFLNFISYT